MFTRQVSSFAASFVRGGTSNGLAIVRSALPEESKWPKILSSAMGSPDPFGRQLDGMGSGLSSTSKICVVSRSSRSDADVDFTFVQVGIRDGSLDMAGNCGNMSSIVGPFAVNERLVKPDITTKNLTTLRIFNTNTSKIIHSTFSVNPHTGEFEPDGDYVMDGVPGRSSCVTLSFLQPGGAKTGKMLPTGNAVDTLRYRGDRSIRATLTDIANPGVFVRAIDLGLEGDVHPDTINNDATLMADLEEIRRAGTTMMGLDPDVQSVPKIVILSAPKLGESADIVCRALSMQQAHKAVPLTLALNLGAACRIPGTLPYTLNRGIDKETITIAHASGQVDVGSVIRDGFIESALLHRTARILMKGEVFHRSS